MFPPIVDRNGTVIVTYRPCDDMHLPEPRARPKPKPKRKRRHKPKR